MLQFKLLQATREAEQAEQAARSLQADARNAQQVASQAEQKAQSVSAQADQAQMNARQARLGVAAVATRVVVQNSAAPVLNTQGQVTGTVVNTTA
jgi:hypothetical protein